MDKKVVLIALIAVLVLFGFVSFMYFNTDEDSADPKTWVEDRDSGLQDISVEKVTEGQSYQGLTGQQVRTATLMTGFAQKGAYEGAEFKEFRRIDGKTVMKIGSDMLPFDGIIEGYIIMKFIDNQPYAYIFVDEDWHQKVRPTNIIWGSDYQFIKEFNFTLVSSGIYMDVIKDERARHNAEYTASKGGLIVGDVTQEQIKNYDYSATYMRLY